ncbi:MAG TPA: 6-phosphofructokinase [Chloroflexia bacterium]|nr:6-phosphofructokinase [Chloroflexia bacterium]
MDERHTTGHLAPATLIVGQSGGATAAINSSLVGVLREARAQGIKRVYGMRNGVRGLLSGDLMDLSNLPVEVLPDLQRTPSAALGSCRYHLTDADVPLALTTLQEHGVHFMVYIGGNDSADTSHKIAQAALTQSMDLRVIAVPKTIDNDLPVTDHCPGYGSAARYIAVATLETTLDTKAMTDIYPVKILETMGRHAGWLAAASSLARTTGWDSPHLIYLPECPKDVDEILEEVRQVYQQKGHVIIVLSENARCKDGRPFSVAGMEALDTQVTSSTGPDFVDSFGHSYYRGLGTGWVLRQLITSRLDLRARLDQPGTLQRMSQAHASEVDLIEAEECGRAAVRGVLAGATDQMVILERAAGPAYRCTIGMTDLEQVANVEKRMPADFLAPGGNNVTDAFIDYALPLVGDQLPQYVELQA